VPEVPRPKSTGSSPSILARKGITHTYALVLNGTYPQVIHNMWKLTYSRGQDVAVGEGWSKVRCRFRGEGGAREFSGSGSGTRPEAGGGS
jgi:hypothetical protein